MKTLYVFRDITDANWTYYWWNKLKDKDMFYLELEDYNLKWLSVTPKSFLERSNRIIERLMQKEVYQYDKFVFIDACGIDVTPLKKIGKKCIGFLHGGSYEPYDLMYKKIPNEEKLLRWFDMLFVQTDHHKKMLSIYKNIKVKKVVFDYLDYFIVPKFTTKQRHYCFAGRLSEDKGYDLIKKRKWITVLRKSLENKSYSDYLRLLGESLYCLIPSRKETLGITAIEAVQNGTIPIVPRTLCFKEILGANKDVWNLISYDWTEELEIMTSEKELVLLDYKYIINELYKSIIKYVERTEKYEKIIASI